MEAGKGRFKRASGVKKGYAFLVKILGQFLLNRIVRIESTI